MGNRGSDRGGAPGFVGDAVSPWKHCRVKIPRFDVSDGRVSHFYLILRANVLQRAIVMLFQGVKSPRLIRKI